MDDIYFTDKKGRRNGNERQTPVDDRFLESDFSESDDYIYSDRASAQKSRDFTVKIPDQKLNTPYTQARTPQGRRRADIPSPPPTRPTQRINTQPTPTYNYNNEQRIPRPADPVSRQPKKPPVAPRKKKKKIGGKIFAVLMLLVVAGILGLFGYGYSVLGEIDYDTDIVDNAYIPESQLMSSSSVTNILIIGSDARDYDGTEGQRSDSMILFSIDKLNKQIKLTSFLRDSYVYIPSADYEDKLNASFSYGGPQLTMDTIEYNFGVKIDHYVIINFELFTQLIDLMGGITVDGVTEDEVYYMTNTLGFTDVKEGTNTLNGYKALWYCRMRMLDDDFHRTQRQRKVVKSLVKQAASTNILELIDIVKQIVPNISTDITQNELLNLGVGAALRFVHYDIVQQQIPADDTWSYDDIDGASVITLNIEQNSQVLKDFIYKKYDESTTTTLVQAEQDDDYDDYYDYDYDYDDDDYYDDRYHRPDDRYDY